MLAFVLTAALTSDATAYVNASVFTASSDHPDATWFVVQEGAFVALGQGDLPETWRGAKRVDLGGRFVMPGFVDAHVHFIDGGLSLLQPDLSRAQSPQEVEAALPRAGPSGWVVARSLSSSATGGELPAHAHFPGLHDAPPTLLLMISGHHAYVNPAGLRMLGIQAGTPDPAGGHIEHDAEGQPNGLLVDQAAWSAVRRVYDQLSPQEIANAIVTAQRLANSYGITAIGDNTFFPIHAVQYLRMAEAGALTVRVALRSYGPVADTRFLMRTLGVSTLGDANSFVRYFGEKHFVDTSLSVATAGKAAEPGGRPHLAADEVAQIFLYAGEYGTAFHVQGRKGLERLLAARRSVGGRRDDRAIDVIDHCGSCSGALAKEVVDAGFLVTVNPLQWHELEEMQRVYGPETTQRLLQLRELYDAGAILALTSDWPVGAPLPLDEPMAFHRFQLAPLANVAMAAHGRMPDRSPVPGAAARTIPLPAALHGITHNGAAAIGRVDLGRIAVGALADFVVLPRSPAEADLYRLDVDETYVGGVRVFQRGIVEAPRATEEFSARPIGWSPSPVIGYDPVPGLILGGALFLYPYEERGLFADLQVMALPQQGARLSVSARALAARIAGPWDLQAFGNFNNWRGRYYGMGLRTRLADEVVTQPTDVQGELGFGRRLGPVRASVDGVYGFTTQGVAADMAAIDGADEGPIDGHRAGLRVAAEHDSRSSRFSTLYGGRQRLWIEGWGAQGSSWRPRLRVGASLAQFIPLYAPDVVLALRLTGGASLGEPAYDTNFQVGGIDVLRGYLQNRFRGHHVAAAGAELRFPIYSLLSGVLFGESGWVWVNGRATRWADTALTYGGGLRFGLPPDQLIKLRFDFGWGRDQRGIFFAFNEAF